MGEDRIISDGDKKVIGRNIRWIRKSLDIRGTEMVSRLQLYNVAINRETLVKIEGGRQHIKLSQLRGLCHVLGAKYEDILDAPGEEITRKIEEHRQAKQAEKRKRIRAKNTRQRF